MSSTSAVNAKSPTTRKRTRVEAELSPPPPSASTDNNITKGDDDADPNAISPAQTFVDIGDECIALILKLLAPHERIRCILICKQMQQCIANQASIWNDVRLSFKRLQAITLPSLTNGETEPRNELTLRFVASQTNYSRDYKNCVQIEIDCNHLESSQSPQSSQISKYWLFHCIQNVEVFDTNSNIYNHCAYFKHHNVCLPNIKYVQYDCISDCRLCHIVQIYPNLTYLSLLNLGHGAPTYDIDAVVFAQLSNLQNLKYLQLWDSSFVQTKGAMHDQPNQLMLSQHNRIFANLVALDLTFCVFANLRCVQQIMNSLSKLEYLSFVSNGIVCKMDVDTDQALDVDFAYVRLSVPETVKYLKYASEILTVHRAAIYLDLSGLQKSGSLQFVDCCVDEILFLEGVSKHCCRSLRYLSLNYDVDGAEFLRKHWDKYLAFAQEQCVDPSLQVGLHCVEGIALDVDDRKQILRQFLMRTFHFDTDEKQIMSRTKLYEQYFHSINNMAKVHEATDFFEW